MSIASLGIDFGVLNALNLWVACLLPPKDNQMQIANIVLHEDRPDLGEIKLVSREMGPRAGAAADQIIVPWSNYNRMLSMWLWEGWLEGTNLCAATSASAPIIRVALDSPPSALVQPALTVASGEFDVPFIMGAKTLCLARFLPERDGRAASGSVLWRATLANEPVSAGAGLGPEKSGSLRRIVLVRQEKQDVVLEVLDLATGRPLSGATNVRIPNCYAMRGSVPGVRVDAEGVTHVALIVANSADLKELSIADASFIPGRDVAPPTLAPACKPTLPPVAAGTAFQTRPDRPMRRDWAVLLADGSVANSMSDEKPMRLEGKPVAPLNLVSLRQSMYILTLQTNGPFLESLH